MEAGLNDEQVNDPDDDQEDGTNLAPKQSKTLHLFFLSVCLCGRVY